MQIEINGQIIEWKDTQITYEQICAIAKQPEYASVAYYLKGEADNSRSGTTYKGKSILVDEGMHISCIVTGNA